MNPKWHIALLAPTYKLGKQKFRDLCNLMPREWMNGDPIEGKMEMPLRDSALAQVYSMDNPDWLVAMAWDRIDGTEMWLAKRQAWANAQTRMSSPGRTELSSAILNSTPGDRIDPDDFEQDHYMWELALDGMDAARREDIETFYWYEMRRQFGNIDHPILSLTPEGREELERKKRDPNFSDQEYDRQYRGRVMILAEGVAVVKNFFPEIHVAERQPMYQAELWRTWDFGLNFPICTFHQFDSKNTWIIYAVCAPINQNKLDIDFADDVLTMTKELFPKFDQSRIHDAGDFEAVQQTDQRVDSTIRALERKGITLIVEPTDGGAEQRAIQVINARMKFRQDGSPNIVIHPRCKILIRALEGKISHPVKKINGVTRIMPHVAEIHPWIDIFDSSIKYPTMHIPNLAQGFDIDAAPLESPTVNQRHDDISGRPL
jgi:hypothetical protein